ncbi:branched-chain amino acid ABC transporter permease [Paramicrobacterium fandaimingii]|uniref:branched-chain amino acid ABC transporter permease n=1 Tax=Paramicrobacterium fandaimingii TaxID=2708079 RepID=UPI0014206B4F|nr:branched-chain amino acid ABC transporter permease [Microbacterium fandaimingii]
MSQTPVLNHKSRVPFLRRYALIFSLLLVIVAIAFPYLVDRPRFWLPNVGIKTLWLGTIAMSLVFLNRYVGLLSLAQMTIAGISSYGVAYATVQLGLPMFSAILIGLATGTLAGFLTALIAARTKAIYFLMITLALGQVFYSWAAQAIEVTNARRGLAPVPRPDWGLLDLSNLQTFYYFALALAIGCYLLCRFVVSTPFGLALQGIRDSPERMSALGYNVNRYRIAGITFAAFIASVGGIVLVLDRSQATPDIVDLPFTLDILVVAVVGGIGSLGGAFIGGIVFVFLDNFAQDFTDRHMTLTGLVFIAVLYLAPAGLAGVGHQLRRVSDRMRTTKPRSSDKTLRQGTPTEPSADRALSKGKQQ